MYLSPFRYCFWTLAISADGQQMSFFPLPVVCILDQRCSSVLVQGSCSPEPGVKRRGSLEESPGLQRVPSPTGVRRLLCSVALSPQPLQRAFLVPGFSMSPSNQRHREPKMVHMAAFPPQTTAAGGRAAVPLAGCHRGKRFSSQLS